MKLKKNDKVMVVKGKSRGKSGKILQVFPADQLIVVEGTHMMVKHARSRKSGTPGEKIQFSAPMSVANVMLICPRCSKNVRVNYKFLDDKSKVRICNKCKEVIE